MFYKSVTTFYTKISLVYTSIIEIMNEENLGAQLRWPLLFFRMRAENPVSVKLRLLQAFVLAFFP